MSAIERECRWLIVEAYCRWLTLRPQYTLLGAAQDLGLPSADPPRQPWAQD